MKPVKKLLCEFCGQQVSASNMSKHLRRHENHPETFKERKFILTHEGLDCQFCGKHCKTKNSLCNHERLCKENPNRQSYTIEGFNNKGRQAWNKGLHGVTHLSESTKQQISQKAVESNSIRKTRPEYESYRQHMRDIALARGLGGFHFRRGVYYNGNKLDSSYEVTVAKSLDNNHIRWERPGRFVYIDNTGKTHYYTPDFYLPEYDVYLDPKNDYLIENGQPHLPYSDKQKIDWVCIQNNIRVLILDKNTLHWDQIKMLVSPSG